MQAMKLALLAVCLFAATAMASQMSTELAVQAPSNPWYAFTGTARFSFRMGSEISVMTASDGKYFYGRGCCYGYYYQLQVWGTGYHGTQLGRFYGVVNAPPVGWDSGNESVLLYIVNSNKLVYWIFRQPTIWIADGQPASLQLTWANVNLNAVTPVTTYTHLSADRNGLIVHTWDSRLLRHVSLNNANQLAITKSITLNSHYGQIVPNANEDSHSFGFDGNYYFFGATHSSSLYSFYNIHGHYNGLQWGWMRGSMVMYDWALGLYQACGTDASSPPAFQVFNANHGNGAHCTYYGNPTYAARPAPPPPPPCPDNIPAIFGEWKDANGFEYVVNQKGCHVSMTGPGRKASGLMVKNGKNFAVDLTFSFTDPRKKSYKAKGIVDTDHLIRFPAKVLQKPRAIAQLVATAPQGILAKELDVNQTAAIRSATRIYLAWSVNTNGGNSMKDYEYVVTFRTTPQKNVTRKMADTGKKCNDFSTFVPVKVKCLKGECNLPTAMYWGAQAGSVCYGNAYGLVAKKGGAASDQCDWAVDSQSYRSIYMGRPGSAVTCRQYKDNADKIQNIKAIAIFSEGANTANEMGKLQSELAALVQENINLVVREKELQLKLRELEAAPWTPGPAGPAGPVGPIGPEGPRGPPGPMGKMGQDGSMGDAGAKGPRGDRGPEGPAGDDGDIGSAGPKGPRGRQGPKGDIGPHGPDGLPGIKGPVGDMGPAGPQGPDGPEGPIGPSGDPGDPGLAGTEGDRGQDGLPGPSGAAGPIGPAGDKGDQGPEGPKGAKGPQGPQGDPGFPGRPGETGPMGLDGPIGDAGPQGLQGPPGPRGAPGPVGPSGDTGDQGPVGDKGPRGLKGPIGRAIIVPGPRGKKGPIGPKGPKGERGPVGDKGPVGPAGPAGPKGIDGVSETYPSLSFMAAHNGVNPPALEMPLPTDPTLGRNVFRRTLDSQATATTNPAAVPV